MDELTELEYRRIRKIETQWFYLRLINPEDIDFLLKIISPEFAERVEISN